ncbi:hypothetical protein F899_01659 [Acinetobacter sp. CIP 101934]|uniref:lysozyme n=1 Tax=Acinetobacter sp. CIP 101934 TaxID=1144661 RepID=UPI0002CFA573|nr:lysozyme [Acinetobacter sp. CIP 101934]ENX01026.1 hypothetical protein F899_01659 [Acinetobacter sp. CIP 101934]
MSIDHTAQIAQAYSWLRAMSGGKLSVDQVMAGDEIIQCHGLNTFSRLIGYTLLAGVTGQWDISEAGYDLIREFEGFKDHAYLDTGGVWTIGYGTIKYPNGTRVRQGDKCTRVQAEIWLKNDCKWVDACLDKYVKAKVSQNQFNAMASFVYNIGETAFAKSTFLTLLNQGNKSGAASQFDRWVFDNSKRVQGLVNRRAKEKALFLKG